MDTTVAVTGAASGLGRVIAAVLLARGARVVLVDRDAETLQDTCAALRVEHGSRVDTVLADLSSIAGIRSAAEAIIATRPGALVNNAGGWTEGEQYPEADADSWLASLTLNLVAPMLLTQLRWPTLAAASGGVVNIGSSGGEGDDAYGSPEYGAGKAGLRRFIASLGDRSDVRVMAIVPGWIGLDRAKAEWAELSAEEQREVGGLIPPEDVAGALVELLAGGRAGEVVEMLRPGERRSTLRRHR